MFRKILILSAMTAFSTQAFAVTDPTSLSIIVYGVAVSANTDCSNATVVGYNAAGTVYDMKSAPTIFNGVVAAGTYQCVILYMNPIVSFKPLANDGGNCVAGTQYRVNVCSSGGCNYTTATVNSSNVLVYGSTPVAATALSTATTSSDKVLLFLSTGSTGASQVTFQQPTAANPNYGLKLTNPMVVSDSGGSGTFVTNFNGKVDGTAGGVCNVNAPVFSFR